MFKRGTRTTAANPLFADLVKAGKILYANEGFKPAYDARWKDKGDRVRGKFHVLNIGRTYRESDLTAALRRESERLGKKLLLATAFELADYARNGWSGSKQIIAFGSSYVQPSGMRHAACLSAAGDERSLLLYWVGDRWDESQLVLCVIE